MIHFEKVISIVQSSPLGIETVRFPVLKILSDEQVYWGDDEGMKHVDMLKKLGESANNVGCAQRVSIFPHRKRFAINNAGASIKADGYSLNEGERLLVETYLIKAFGSIADGEYLLLS